MAETPRGQFTITLGRSGQVVKRDGPVSYVGFSNSMPAIGTKPTVRDRLGSNVENSAAHGSQLNSKQWIMDMSHMTALKQMGESDRKELGIPMGPRKKILLALLPRS